MLRREVGGAPALVVGPVGAGHFVLIDSGLHQLLTELDRDLAVVGELDEAFASLVAGCLDLGSPRGEEPWREAERAMVLEALKHPQAVVLAANVGRKLPLQLFSCMLVGLEAELTEQLEVRPLGRRQPLEVILDA